jgi:hypothetical protein
MAQVTGRLPTLHGMYSTITPCSAHSTRRGFNYEPPGDSTTLVPLIQALRAAPASGLGVYYRSL